MESTSDDGAGTTITRRSLLSGTLGLWALSGPEWTPPSTPAGETATTTALRPGSEQSDHLPFSVWSEVRDALRSSPDHLPARADRLVERAAAGDDGPEELFRFVRDEVVTLPPSVHEVGDHTRAARWGIRGTLRGGAGTPREKTDLLADLYRRAGWTAAVVVAPRSLSEAAVQRLLFRQPDREFAPDIDGDQLAEWRERLGTTDEPVPDVSRIDRVGRESEALAAELRPELPIGEDRSPPAFDFEWGEEMLVVRVETDDEPVYANLFDLDVPFGDPGVDPVRLEPAPAADDTPDVEVTLSVTTERDVTERFELVTGRWRTADLVGRQVLVQTLPGTYPLGKPDVTFEEVRSFVPTLTLQDVNTPRDDLVELSVWGDPVDLTVWDGPPTDGGDSSPFGGIGGIAGDDGESDGDGESDEPSDRLAGLYLTVSVGGRTVEQTIAGWDPVRHVGQAVTGDVADEVAGAMFGNTYVSFEATAPPAAVWFDDFLGAKSSVAALDRALADDGDTLDTLEAGFESIPSRLFQLTCPLPRPITDESLTFPDGPRVTVFHQHPVFGTNRVVERGNVVPVTRFATAAVNPRDRFELTFERTARLAIVEDLLFETSTRSLLANADLDPWAEAGQLQQRDAWRRLLDRTQRRWSPLGRTDGGDGAASTYHLVPADGTPFTYWNVDRETGSLLGILWDGSGGGLSERTAACRLDRTNRLLSLTSLYVSLAGSAGMLTPYGAFVAGSFVIYGKTLSRQVTAAALALRTMDPDAYDRLVDGWGANLACSVAKQIFFAVVGARYPDVGAVSDLDTLVSVMGGTSPISCSLVEPGGGTDAGCEGPGV